MKQKLRFTDAELALIKSLFADNDALVTVVRKVFFEKELTPNETQKLDTLKSDKAKAVIRKIFLPELDLEAPIGQMIDLLMTVNFTNLSPVEAHNHIKARHLVIELLDAHLKELDGETPTISYQSLSKLTDNAEIDFIQLTARNSYIAHIEAMLNQIVSLAGRKDETPEQTIERLHKDSAK